MKSVQVHKPACDKNKVNDVNQGKMGTVAQQIVFPATSLRLPNSMLNKP